MRADRLGKSSAVLWPMNVLLAGAAMIKNKEGNVKTILAGYTDDLELGGDFGRNLLKEA